MFVAVQMSAASLGALLTEAQRGMSLQEFRGERGKF